MLIRSLRATLATALLLTQQAFSFSDRAGQCVDNVSEMIEEMAGKNDVSLGWSMAVSGETFAPGGTLTVTIQSKTPEETFKGLLLYARVRNNYHIGSWIDLGEGFKTLDDDCSEYGAAGSTLSHSNADDKPGNANFTWQAPTGNFGNVEFRGIVVTKNKETWQQLKPILVRRDGNATAAAPPAPENSATRAAAGMALPAAMAGAAVLVL